MRASAETSTAASALVVAMLRQGAIEECEDFIEWFLENFDADLTHLLPAELEADFDG